MAASLVNIVLGVVKYHDGEGITGITSKNYLGILNLCVFIGILIIIEIIFQVVKRGETPFIEVHKKITLEEFEKLIAKGDQLVVLDDNVLDVTSF